MKPFTFWTASFVSKDDTLPLELSLLLVNFLQFSSESRSALLRFKLKEVISSQIRYVIRNLTFH